MPPSSNEALSSQPEVPAPDFAGLTFREYQPGDAAAFVALNRAWIEEFFIVEPEDEILFSDPEAEVLVKGGRIYFVIRGEEIIGTCALVYMEPGRYELAKMAVRKDHQGQGIGRMLLERVVAEAALLGARSLFLQTNQRLGSAVHLYESLGFRRVAAPESHHAVFARADVSMELILD